MLSCAPQLASRINRAHRAGQASRGCRRSSARRARCSGAWARGCPPSWPAAARTGPAPRAGRPPSPRACTTGPAHRQPQDISCASQEPLSEHALSQIIQSGSRMLIKSYTIGMRKQYTLSRAPSVIPGALLQHSLLCIDSVIIRAQGTQGRGAGALEYGGERAVRGRCARVVVAKHRFHQRNALADRGFCCWVLLLSVLPHQAGVALSGLSDMCTWNGDNIARGDPCLHIIVETVQCDDTRPAIQLEATCSPSDGSRRYQHKGRKLTCICARCTQHLAAVWRAAASGVRSWPWPPPLLLNSLSCQHQQGLLTANNHICCNPQCI